MRTTLISTFDGTIGSITSYTQSSVLKGNLIQQYTDTNGKKYLQPLKYNTLTGQGAINMYSAHANITSVHPTAISWSDDVDYIFTVYQLSQANVVQILLTKYTLSTNTYLAVGRLLLYFSMSSAAVRYPWFVQGYMHRYTNGTVAVNGLSVTGIGTSFSSSGMAAGARIGFGTSSHAAISTWYDINNIISDTSLGLTFSAGSYSAGTPYVIEELRLHVLHTRAGTTQQYAGYSLVKGIHEGCFNSVLYIYEATRGFSSLTSGVFEDNIRAHYLLEPGVYSTASQFPGIGGVSQAKYYYGLALDEPESDATQHSYVWSRMYDNNATRFEILKYNVRAPLTMAPTSSWYAPNGSISTATGSTTNAFMFRTGSQSIAGTFLQGGTIFLGTPSHGPGAGQRSLLFLTTGRIYQIPLSLVASGSNTWLAYSHTNIPPGTSNTMVGITYNQFVWMQKNDTFMTSAQATPWQSNFEKFSLQTNSFFWPWIGKYRSASIDNNSGEYYTNGGVAINHGYNESKGILHTIASPGGSTFNYIYPIPIDADHDYAIARNQFAMTQKFETPNNSSFYNVRINQRIPIDFQQYRVPTGTLRAYARTSGIEDNTGTWSRIPDNGDISAVFLPANQIQFAVTWEIASMTGVVPYVYSVEFSYEDSTQDPYYYPSLNQSSSSSRIFAFIQAQAWNSSIPNLRMRLYNASTGFLITDDTVAGSAFGTWEYSTDSAATWATWSSAADSVGNYIRYTANSLPANTIIRALLTTN